VPAIPKPPEKQKVTIQVKTTKEVRATWDKDYADWRQHRVGPASRAQFLLELLELRRSTPPRSVRSFQ
jgi:hypothetical protein